MSTEYFGFKQNPFGLANDSSFFCVDSGKEEAYEHILCDLKNNCSLIVVTGSVNSGRVQLLRRLVNGLPSNIRLITVIDNDMNYPTRVMMSIDLMAENCHDGTHLLLVVDKADDLSDANLKLLSLLPNHTNGKVQSFQMIWLGSHELNTKLNQLDSKKYKDYPHNYRLDGLDETHVKRYILRRLEQAGYSTETRGEIFSSAAIKKIALLSHGDPYSINVLCNASLMIAIKNQQEKVCERLVEDASKLSLASLDKYEQSNTHQNTNSVLDNTKQLPKKINIRIQYTRENIQGAHTLKNQQAESSKQLLNQSSTPLLPLKYREHYIDGAWIVGLCFLSLVSFPYIEKAVKARSETIKLMRSSVSVAQNSTALIDTNAKHTKVSAISNRTQKLAEQLKAGTIKHQPDLAIQSSKLNNHFQDTLKAPHQTDEARAELMKSLQKEDRIKRDSPESNSINLAHTKEVQHAINVKQKTKPINLAHAKEVQRVVNVKQKSNPKHILAENDAPTKISLKVSTHQQHPNDVKKQPTVIAQNTEQANKQKVPKIIIQKQASNPIIDEQEAATRDRAASRLSLDKMGIEFSADSLVTAAHKGDLRVVKLLIAGGVPHNIKNRDGQTALMASTKNGHKHIVKELLKGNHS